MCGDEADGGVEGISIVEPQYRLQLGWGCRMVKVGVDYPLVWRSSGDG